MTSKDRELVAVPDASATMSGDGTRYRLGVRPTSAEASFTLGETGPNGQSFPWIYLRGEGATYEIDLLDGELTVTTRQADGDNVQAVVYKIDVESMTGQEVKEGEPVRIVFAYDQLLVDETTQVDSWVATTGPRYIEELRARLGKTDTIVIEMQSDISAAMEGERFGHASRAPRSAEPLHSHSQQQSQDDEIWSNVGIDDTVGFVDLTSHAPAPEAVEEVIDLDEGIEASDPDAVQIVDPATGVVYVGRTWKRGQRTTFRSLKNASYRVAILTLLNGESATVVLQHPKGVPAIQLTTKHGVVRQFLADAAWDQDLKPGTAITLNVSGPMGGDRPIPRGFIPLAPVGEIAATGPQAAAELSYPKNNSLAKFRAREEELVHGHGPSQGMSRNLVA